MDKLKELGKLATVEDGGMKDDKSTFMMILGSGANFIKIKPDGTSVVLALNSNCGRGFMGLGRLLTGAKSFDDLIELASLGDEGNVNECGRDLNPPDIELKNDEAHIYTGIPPWASVFLYGKATNMDRESFKKEDLARALLYSLVMEIVYIVAQSCHKETVKKIYVCGGLAEGSALVRKQVQTTFFYMKIQGLLVNTEIKFLKHGAFLGAIGAMLSKS